jgi:hypothetical protein
MAQTSTAYADDTYYSADNAADTYADENLDVNDLPPNHNIEVDLDYVFAEIGIFFVVLLVCCPFMFVIAQFVKRRVPIHPDTYLNAGALARHPEPTPPKPPGGTQTSNS